MSLTPQEVEHIALLARLELTPYEKEQYRRQLSSILDYFSVLQKLDTSHIPPTSSVLPPRTRLRKDEMKPGLDQNETLLNASDTTRGQFRVPPVFVR